MSLEQLNKLSFEQLKEELFKCCGSTKWAQSLADKSPFASVGDLKQQSDSIWNQCNDTDWKEAFTHHPKIGDVKLLEEKFASTKQWASGEQSGVNTATREILQSLADGNLEYENKFGYIFIVCATGKAASEMLHLLTERLKNNPDQEILIAKEEQNKITHLRLHKLLS
jgi:2-oxo-4-hydroxy-4-carboxy-5-ureidoimidazoline decarboxylase